jgi:hypothetical protein
VFDTPCFVSASVADLATLFRYTQSAEFEGVGSRTAHPFRDCPRTETLHDPSSGMKGGVKRCSRPHASCPSYVLVSVGSFRVPFCLTCM